MTPAEAKALFPPFLEFTKALEGDEKSEAQIFLDHLFRALGHDGVKEAGVIEGLHLCARDWTGYQFSADR